MSDTEETLLAATLSKGPDQGTAATVPHSAAPGTGPGTTTVTGAARVTVLPRIVLRQDRAEVVVDSRQRFETVGSLGEGGAGEVVAARDHDIGRQVAVKRIRACVKSTVALHRFVEEIRTIGRLEHPNIVPIHDVGVDEAGDYYFVMKYVDGETLESIVKKLAAGDREYHRSYGYERRVQIFRGIMEAIAFAHSQGVVHRDIKPSNVMVGRFGEVLVMDWGIAKSMREGTGGFDDAFLECGPGEDEGEDSRLLRTQAGALIGTPVYMSPEQARGEPVDERSDVYSLGILLFELLTLHHPLEKKDSLEGVLKAVREEEVPLAGWVRSPHQPPVPMDLVWYLRRCLYKDRARRYASVPEMLLRLDRRAEGIIPIECHLTLTKRITGEWTRFMERHPLLVTAGMVLFFCAAAASVIVNLL